MYLSISSGKKNMKKITLSTLEIQILLKCSKDTFTKSDLSRFFMKNSLLEKQKMIRRLIIQDLILEQALPKIGSKKIPIFYSLTEKGKKWVVDYKKNYPAT